MSDIIKKVSIAGTGAQRDIGAEAQNVEISYDSAGNIILDIEDPSVSVDSTKTLPEVLSDTPKKSHASTTTEYGAASTTEYGHMKAGTGLDANNGEISVKYGSTAGTAVVGNDSRLSAPRKNPNPVTFSNGTTNVDYDGSVGRTVNNETVGAAPTNHADSTDKYGRATTDKYGHVKIGEGLEDKDGSLALSIATKDDLGGVKVDGETITIDEDGTLHGGGSGGSNVEIYTDETTLYGQTVTITATEGSDPVEVTFDESGYAIVKGFMGTGTVIFTSSDGSQTASGSMNIPYFGNYSITLAFWAAPITITTSTADMYGRTVIVKRDGLTVGTTAFNGSGVATYTAHAVGTYDFECTLDWKTFSSSLVVSAETAYNVNIIGFVANISVTTTTPEFYGATVTVSGEGDVPTTTINFDGSGNASYKAYQAGTYTFAVSYGGESYPKNVTVVGQQSYTVAINLWTAIVNINSNDFANATGQVYDISDGEDSPIFVSNFSFDSAGVAECRIHKAGEYKFSITNSD